MNDIHRFRWPRPGMLLLAVALLLAAPTAQAQVWAPQPTPHMMEQQRADIEARLGLFDERLAQFEARIAAAPADRRAELRAEFNDLQRQRQQLRQDVTGLRNVQAAQWTQRFRPVHERLTELETQTLQWAHAHGWIDTPPMAERTRIRADFDRRAQALDQRITHFEAQIERAPATERPALQAHLDDMRRERDVLRRDIAALETVPAEQWVIRLQPIETRLAMFETHVQHMEPVAQARVGVTPPTAEQMRILRTDLDERLVFIDNEIATVEGRIGALPAGTDRTDLETRLATVRTERDALRMDVAALEGVPSAEFYARYEPVGQRMARLESEFHGISLAAIPARRPYISMGEQTLEAQRQRIAEMNRQLDALPAEQRAAVAYELIQLRTQYDEAWRLHQRMRFAPVARYNVLRDDFATAVAQLQTDVQLAHVNMAVSGHVTSDVAVR